jgi:hypothetical protein
MDRLTGFGRLQAPVDLLRKLRHDYSRIGSDPSVEYAAFDFFVTAEHMIDWLLPGNANKKEREQLRASDPLLEITWDIASGVKHFVVEAPGHESVSHADVALAAFDPVAFDREAFQTADELFVTLEGRAAARFGSRLGVLPLAALVLAYWEHRFVLDVSTS